MNKKSNNKNFILTGADGGTIYTLAVAIPLVLSIVYSIVLIASGLVADENFTKSSLSTYLSFGLSSVSLFLVVLYAVKKNQLDFKQTISFARCENKYYLIAILLAFGSLFGLGWINDAFISFLQSLGFELSEITLPKNHFGDFILCTIIVCVLPAFFEESIFRGLILNGARRAGDTFAVIACGILFSLFHKNPTQTIYQFVMGAVFTLLTLKSGSVLPAMIFHFINNFYVVVYYFLAPENYVFELWLQITLFVLGIIAFVLTLLYLVLKCKKPLRDENLDKDYAEVFDKKIEKRNFLIFALPGIFACLIFWVINLIGA